MEILIVDGRMRCDIVAARKDAQQDIRERWVYVEDGVIVIIVAMGYQIL